MPRKIYDKAIKTAFTKAAKDARAAGKTWDEAFTAAHTAGYTGTVGSLTKMLTAPKGKKAGSKKAAAPVLAERKLTPAIELPAPEAVVAAASAEPKPKGRPKATAKPASAKKRGPHLYDEATKAAIIKAAFDARSAGKTWSEALDAAKAAGYRGQQLALSFFVKHATKPAKKPGRPAGKRLGRPATTVAATAVSGPDDLMETIDRVVKARVRAALDQALAVLRQAQG